MMFIGWGCSTTLYLPDNKLLLQDHPSYERIHDKGRKEIVMPDSSVKKIKTGKLSIDLEALWSATRTKPNRKILFFKPYLNLYNIGLSIKKFDLPFEKVYRIFSSQDNLFDEFADVLINTAGEPPVLIDTTKLNSDARNIESLYFSRGFFNAKVDFRIDTIVGEYENNKAKAVFEIQENEVYIIDSIVWNAEEPTIQSALRKDSKESLLKKGANYNEQALSAERNRISAAVRKLGFFKFTPSFISYKIDTNLGHLPEYIPSNKDSSLCRAISVVINVEEPHPMYRVGNVRLFLEPSEVLLDDIPFLVPHGVIPDDLRQDLDIPDNMLRDTLHSDFLIYKSLLGKINIEFLDKLVALRPGSIWSTTNERNTQRRLQDLGIFKFVLVKYKADDSLHTIDVEIQAQFIQRFGFKAGLEGFTRQDQVLQSQLPGIGGEINFTDKYLFKGAEHLEVGASGNIAFYRAGEDQPLQAFYEIGGKAQLSFPRFLLPFQGGANIARFTPRTNLQANIKSEHRNEYDRLQLGANWGYSWFHSSLNNYSRSSLSPYVITLIRSRLSPQFQDQIRNIESDFLRSFVELDFKSRFSSKFSYKYTYADYGTTRAKNTHYFQPIIEFGGNTPYLIDRFLLNDGSYKDGRIDSIYYGQFVKASTEFKKFVPLRMKGKELIFRAYTGVAIPWNNTTQVPFDSRFFAGGTSSMRGWQSNSLGPGSYSSAELQGDTREFEFLISPGGEFVLEGNFEFRTNVYKFIELAIFSDVGNVWFLPGSSFQFQSGILSKDFYRQLGWDAGLGVRLDFSFFVFRVDMAHQIYAPDLQDFVVKSFPKDLGGNRFQINFGIGYPF